MLLKKSFIVITFILCFINTLIFGVYTGFAFREDVSSVYGDWFVSGGNGYYEFANYHLFLVIALSGFIIGKLVEKELISQAVCFVSLISAISLYIQLYIIKKNALVALGSYERFIPYLSLLKETIFFDWVCFFVLISIFVYQIITVFQCWFNKKII